MCEAPPDSGVGVIIPVFTSIVGFCLFLLCIVTSGTLAEKPAPKAEPKTSVSVNVEVTLPKTPPKLPPP